MFALPDIRAKISMDLSKLTAGFSAGIAQSNSFGDKIRGTFSKLDQSVQGSLGGFSRLATAITGALGGLSLFGSIGFGVKLAADFEQASIAMEVMLGSATKAHDMLKQIQSFAAATPFSQSGLIDASKTLLGFGIAGDQVMPILDRLSNVAQGSEEKLKSLSLVFGQISAAGKLSGQDLNQLIGAGFNPLAVIAARTGESLGQVKDRMQDGAVGIGEVTQAFVDATSEGGRFFGMNDRMSQTLIGRWSTFKDSVNESLRSVGESIMRELDLSGALESFTKGAESIGMQIGPMIGQVARWAAAHKDLIVNLGGTVAALTAAAIVLPKLTAGFNAAVTAAFALGGALKFAIANPILTVGIGAVAAFTAVMARSIAMNEKWAESAYQISRSMGLFQGADQNIGNLQSKFGELKNDAADLRDKINKATSLGGKLDAGSDLLDDLRQQLDVAKQIHGLQQKSGIDVGFGDGVVEGIRKQMEAVESAMDKLRDAKIKAGMPEIAPSMPDPAAGMEKVKHGTHHDTYDPIGNAVKAAIDGAKRLHDALEGFREGLRTPVEILKEQTDQLAAWRDAGLITIDEYQRGFNKLQEGFEPNQELNAKLDAFKDSLETPTDKFKERVQELKDWLDKGLITKDQFEKSVAKEQKNLPGSETSESHLAGFIRSGSQEALKLQFASQGGGGGTRAEKLAEQHLAESRKQSDSLEILVRNGANEVYG